MKIDKQLFIEWLEEQIRIAREEIQDCCDIGCSNSYGAGNSLGFRDAYKNVLSILRGENEGCYGEELPKVVSHE